jgi:hypothetical protein
MANATIQGKIVDNRRVILDLSMNEAIAIRTLTGSVMGCPCTTIRKHIHTVGAALATAGIKSIQRPSGGYMLQPAEFRPVSPIDNLIELITPDNY